MKSHIPRGGLAFAFEFRIPDGCSRVIYHRNGRTGGSREGRAGDRSSAAGGFRIILDDDAGLEYV